MADDNAGLSEEEQRDLQGNDELQETLAEEDAPSESEGEMPEPSEDDEDTANA